MAVSYQELRKKINQNKQALGQIEKYLREGEYLEKDIDKNAYEIEERLKRAEATIIKLKELEELRENLKNVKEFVEEKKKVLEAPKHKLKNYLGAELERSFGEKGWKTEGNLPELRVGVLDLEFLLSQGQVKIWYGPKIELLSRTRLVTDDVANAVIKAYKDLDIGSFKDEEVFLKLLFEAYNSLIKKGGSDFGANVSIIHWLREIAWHKQDKAFLIDPRREHFKSYGRTQLSYDLSCLKRREYGAYQLRLVVASREQTKKKDDNLWIPNNLRGDGTHFASVCFRQRISSENPLYRDS
jgi:hypothetical protein